MSTRRSKRVKPVEARSTASDIVPYRNSTERHMLTSFTETSKDSIFVSVASYRDCECINTVSDIFFRAAFPQRITVGVCQQNIEGLDDDIDLRRSQVYQLYKDQIRILDMSAYDAKGPMLARARIEQELLGDETFYLQLDSHCMLVPHWDELLIQELLRCPSEKPILTTYPHDFDRQTRKPFPHDVTAPYLRFREFHPRLRFSEQERRNFAVKPTRPQPSLFWAAGFSFTLSQAVREVPYDPHCPFVFVGEEMSHALRFYTHGWDLFAPTVNIVYHLMKRTYRPVFWEQVYKKKAIVNEATRQVRKAEEERGVERIRALVSGQPIESPYGLGKKRTIKQWEDHVGVNIKEARGSRRSYLGLTPHADAEERRAKYFIDK